MSQNMTGRNKTFNIKVGDTSTLIVTIDAPDGTAKDLSDSTVYNTAKFKVWDPNGTLIINGSASYVAPRTSGQISYALKSADTVLANMGNWEGEIECHDSNDGISDQSDTFNFKIGKSY